MIQSSLDFSSIKDKINRYGNLIKCNKEYIFKSSDFNAKSVKQ